MAPLGAIQLGTELLRLQDGIDVGAMRATRAVGDYPELLLLDRLREDDNVSSCLSARAGGLCSPSRSVSSFGTSRSGRSSDTTCGEMALASSAIGSPSGAVSPGRPGPTRIESTAAHWPSPSRRRVRPLEHSRDERNPTPGAPCWTCRCVAKA